MKSFYNQKSKSIEVFEKHNEYIFSLDVPATYGLNFYKSLDFEMGEFVKSITKTDNPTVFKIKGDFNIIREHGDEVDLLYFLMSIANIFASHLITKERTDGEFRLSAPKNIASIKLNSLVKQDLANKKLLFPIFAIDIEDKDGKVFYEVI